MIRYRNGTWEIVVYAGRDPATNRERRVSRSIPGPHTKRIPKAVRDREAALIVEVNQGQHGSPHVTVGELLDRWLAHVRDDLSPTTLHGYDQVIRLYLKPDLGKVRLAKLTTGRIDGLYATLRATGGEKGTGVAPATIRQAHAVLRRALGTAKRWGWISTNPAAEAAPPPVRRKPIPVHDTTAVTKLIDAADEDLADLIALARSTGARRGELCGLRWSDLDLEHRAGIIARSVVEIDHKLIVKAPKSGRARALALGDKITARLTARHDRMTARAARMGAELVADAYVLSEAVDGSTPLHPNIASDRFRRHTRTLKVTIRLHDLRHSAVSTALAAGVPASNVAEHHGHASTHMTLDVYGHVITNDQRAVADAIDIG